MLFIVYKSDRGEAGYARGKANNIDLETRHPDIRLASPVGIACCWTTDVPRVLTFSQLSLLFLCWSNQNASFARITFFRSRLLFSRLLDEHVSQIQAVLWKHCVLPSYFHLPWLTVVHISYSRLIFASMLATFLGLLLFGEGSRADGATSLSNWNQHRCLQPPHRRRSNSGAVIRPATLAWTLFMTGAPSRTEVRSMWEVPGQVANAASAQW